METLYPPNDEDGAPGDGDDDVLSQELKESFNQVKDLLSSSHTKEEAQNMATKTAIQAVEEMNRLQNGIAELEALLAAQLQEEQQRQNAGVAVPAFPALPPVIVEEEEEETMTTTGKGTN